MLVIDAKDKLEYRDLVEFFRKLQENVILVTFENNPKDTELLLQKEEIVNVLFNRDYTTDLRNKNISVTLFNENVLLETTIDEIHRLSTPARIKKYLELTGVEIEEEEEIIEIEVEEKTTPIIETKTIAIGNNVNGEVEDIETITITRRETRKAVDFLNEKISMYYIHKLQDYIRVCVDYDKEEKEWLTVEDLFEKGIAT